jgi:Putative prokaryotic signal transducing protein
MEPTRQDLEARYREIDDDELLRRFSSGTLIALAQSVARDELRRRRLPIPKENPAQTNAQEPMPGDGDDLVAVARFFATTDAHILAGLLTAEGVPAFVADVHATQAQPHLAIATGGVRVLVHAREEKRAHEIVAAFNRGEYSLADDAEIP